MLLSTTLTLNEWIVLINQDREHARQHIEWLRSQVKEGNYELDPALILSIENYDRAQQLIISATDNPKVVTQLANRMALGRATLGKYPDQDAWLAFITADPTFARRLHQELRGKQMLLGRGSPPSLVESIAIYDALLKQQEGTQQ